MINFRGDLRKFRLNPIQWYCIHFPSVFNVSAFDERTNEEKNDKIAFQSKASNTRTFRSYDLDLDLDSMKLIYAPDLSPEDVCIPKMRFLNRSLRKLEQEEAMFVCACEQTCDNVEQ